jgi:rare lipoprotein A
MRIFASVRDNAGLVLVISGSAFLLIAQQLLGVATFAHTTSVVGVHNLESLPEAKPPVAATRVNAATMTGHFEEPLGSARAAADAPAHAPAPEPDAAEVAEKPAAPKQSVFQSGVASTYGEGDGFEGNLTACGQVFHTNVAQIAHKSLPCGTMVRVEDADTGRSVDAEVTDRGPYVAGRVVDLSWGAFKRLHPAGPGLLHVNVYVLDK